MFDSGDKNCSPCRLTIALAVRDTEDREIIGFRGPRGEKNLGRGFPDQRGYSGASLLD